MSENYELLYAGFDTLYVTIQGALDQAQLDKLQAARTESQRTQTAQPIYIGPGQYDAQVHPAGQRGGYDYRLEAGPTDLVWSIKHSTDVRQWNLFAAAGSACLLTHGLDSVKAMIWRDLKTMGARWADHKSTASTSQWILRLRDYSLTLPASWLTRSRASATAQDPPMMIQVQPNPHADVTLRPSSLVKCRRDGHHL